MTSPGFLWKLESQFDNFQLSCKDLACGEQLIYCYKLLPVFATHLCFNVSSTERGIFAAEKTVSCFVICYHRQLTPATEEVSGVFT